MRSYCCQWNDITMISTTLNGEQSRKEKHIYGGTVPKSDALTNSCTPSLAFRSVIISELMRVKSNIASLS